MLIIRWDEGKIRNWDNIDRLVSAEIPGENENRELNELVKKCLIHTTCWVGNLSFTYKENGLYQNKSYKSFCRETFLNINEHYVYHQHDS